MKYSMASDCPGRRENTRRTPAVISGNVIPKSTDCGKMSSAASDHLNTVTAAVDPARRGSTRSYAIAVAATNAWWNARPSTPMAASVAA